MVRQRLADLFGSIPSFGFRLDHTGWFGADVLWLAPGDPAPFRALTGRVLAEFPAYPPFGGRFPDVVPHLTVGSGRPRGELCAAEEAVRPQLPIEGAVRSVTLLTGPPGGRWQRTATFGLA